MARRPSTVNATNHDDPLWYKDAVVYQLHIKSFYDANGDGVGDFAGLIERLDYIKSLGVDTIWLLPFYPSPRRDDGYDIAEYTGVHSDYGTLADARRFIDEAHERGLRVITELVINHTSDQHAWFQRAREAKPGSAARNFYVWSDTDQTYSGTRVIFCDTEKSNWTWDPVAGAYFWHRFYSHQPDLNFDNPQVLAAVMRIMRFWLDLGVDGLRLDAVPYLIERDGTSNENLPETHDILKRIRAHMDASYKNRLLLAEANQWPEDAQLYFGASDECNMAFHFPLMPRMYMAIAKEDRFPITDIMQQTPDIPEDCQWAIFLRNHDELTLEMVTSSERDYLWETYASDRRARINLGIRRRLAPLLERDRRRIELINSLLLSMRGTPVIYYGDEIGMGDNIHLGDRDGVRTPMQWSPDRNGGFSKADPERLVLPPIMGALYGFDAVNVEAQHRDPHSLLNWTRRMLALRQSTKAFGRGTLRFLHPGNRKILAYVREYQPDGKEELILCVANLSRAPQAVELDLSAYNGRVPVEMLGSTSFPAVGTLPYMLTLPPYGFYWFVLSAEAKPPTWYQAAPEQLQDFVTLVLHNRLSTEMTTTSRAVLEREVLPAYLQRRRWFAAKGQTIKSTRICYATPMPHAADLFFAEVEVGLEVESKSLPSPYPSPADAGEGNRPMVALPLPHQRERDRVRAAGFQIRNEQPAPEKRVDQPADEQPDTLHYQRYLLPVGILWGEDNQPALPQQLALARLRRAANVGLLTDAFTLAPFALALVNAIKHSEHFPALGAQGASHGELVCVPEDGIDAVVIDAQTEVRWLAAEQSNSSLIVANAGGKSAMLKLMRRVGGGIHPEAEMTRHLTRIGYANTPALLGEMRRIDADGVPHTLAVLQAMVENQGDGWAYTLDHLDRLLSAAAAADTEDDADIVADYALFASAIGKRLAELHQVLSASAMNTDEAFAPKAADADDVAQWAADAHVQIEKALRLIEHSGQQTGNAFDEETALQAVWLIQHRDALLALTERLAAAGLGVTRSRIHGDFHLGQILVVQSDAWVIDFEGEPAKPLEARRRKTSGLRDVAGLLRSFDYATAWTNDPSREGLLNPTLQVREQRNALAQGFRSAAEQAFLQAYWAVAHRADEPWTTKASEGDLLDLFLLEKAAYEIAYESANRPTWLSVPVRGMAQVAERLLGHVDGGAA